MIDFDTAINLVRMNGGFIPNKREDSYYRTYATKESRPMQVRISNHGTHLWTWYDKEYDPSYAINTCIVYSADGSNNSNVNVDMNLKDKHNNVVGQRNSFEVVQYVYNCQLLDENDSALINQAIQSIWQNKGFIDSLSNTPKHAKVYKLRPNQTIETIVENKEYKTNTNMAKKQVIRLTEGDLHRFIKEAVKNILSGICK